MKQIESTDEILKRIQDRRDILDNLKKDEYIEFTIGDIAPLIKEFKFVKLKHNKIE